MKLGRYEVVRELGKGAMGIVYLAKDPLIGRLVALKTIRASAHADDDESKEFQQRFVREAQAAGILNHPAIVTVFDIGQDEATGMSFIAMEYVEGSNLKEVLAQGRPLTYEQIGDIISQIADALDFAHAKGIVHRDVKPANIILLEGNRAKITDFGIAKIATGGNLTSTGQFLGTPNYMAPEQIKGTPVDGRTDIFSLGICLYECLTRRKPFGGDSLTSISYKIVHESFAPLREVNPQIPEGYNEVVTTSLAKDPARRYQRGKDMAAAIRAALRGEKVPHRDPAAEESTLITDRGHIPTMELPFPEASLMNAESIGTATTAAAAAAAEANLSVSTEAAAKTRPVKNLPAVPAVVRKTLDGVRASPLWRRSLPAVMFFGIVVVALTALAFSVLNIRRRTPEVPKVDTFMESRVAKQRQLRVEANQLLREGRLIDAYAKFEELNRLAPSSPSVNLTMQKLSRIRQQDEITRQQLADAERLYNEGLALFSNQQFASAIEKFQASFHLNPSSEQTATYLKLAQQEDQKQREARLAAARSKNPPKTSTAPAHTVAAQQPLQASVVPSAPAQFTTTFNSPVSDGFIVVKVGADTVAQENLFQEVRRVFKRRVPRTVNVTSSFPAKNADVTINVVIPSMQISEHKTLRGNFTPGSTHHLVVSFDPKTRQFGYQLD